MKGRKGKLRNFDVYLLPDGTEVVAVAGWRETVETAWRVCRGRDRFDLNASKREARPAPFQTQR